EVAARLADIAGAAHDRQARQATPGWQALMCNRRRQPQQQGGQPKAIAQQLRRGQAEAISELAEDAESPKAASRADDKRHPRDTATCGRWHHRILSRRLAGYEAIGR